MARQLSDHLCECGTCGLRTYLAPCSDARRGWVKGQPLRYRNGHWLRQGSPYRPEQRAAHARIHAAERAAYEQDPCWVRIIAASAARYRVSVAALHSRDHTERVGHARVQTYLAMAEAGASYAHIARVFGRVPSAISQSIAARRALAVS